MTGRVLFEAIGTGIDIRHFPPGREIIALDISGAMLRRAGARARQSIRARSHSSKWMRKPWTSPMLASIPP